MRPEEATPLVPKGFGGPKFPEDAQNKFIANEDENAYVQLEVFGDPAPIAEWFRVSGDCLNDDWDLADTQFTRYKSWTDGKNGWVGKSQIRQIVQKFNLQIRVSWDCKLHQGR